MLSSSVGAGLAARQAVSCLCVSSLAQFSLLHRAAHTAAVPSPGRRSPSTVLANGPGFDKVDASYDHHSGLDGFKGMLQQQLEQTSARLARQQVRPVVGTLGKLAQHGLTQPL